MEANLEIKKETTINITRRSVSGGGVLKILLFIFISAIVILPILITVFASFKSLPQIGSESALKPPASLNFENYKEVLKSANVFVGFKNSMILV
ncbi:hypothetical protein V7161_21805, partial [Neobacillus drentensis]